MGTREERVSDSAGGVRENITDKETWAENRRKAQSLPRDKNQDNLFTGVYVGMWKAITQRGLASNIHGCHIARAGEMDR